jgi:hypothetical protein
MECGDSAPGAAQPEKVVLSGVRQLVAAFRSRPESCSGGQVSPQKEKRRPVAALHTVCLIYAQASNKFIGEALCIHLTLTSYAPKQFLIRH